MKNFSKLLCLIMILLMCSQSVFAAVSIDDAKCNDELVTLNITADGNVTVKLIKYGDSESDYNSPEVPPLDLDFITVNGSTEYQLCMPTSTAGKYTVIATDEQGNKDSASFLFAVLSNASGILKPIKEAEDGDEIYELISNSAAELAIDTSDSGDEDFKSYGKSACNILYGTIHDFGSVIDLKDALYGAIALSAIKGKDDTIVKSYLEKYESNLGISFATDYTDNSSLTQEIKSELLYLYANADFISELSAIKNLGGNLKFSELCDILYDRFIALSAVRKNTGGYLNLKKLYETDYNSILGGILSSNSDYTSDNSEAVFEELADTTKYNFTKFSDLTANFNRAVKAVSTPAASTVGNKPGPGGGSGGSYSVPAGAVNKDDNYENNLSGGTAAPGTPAQKPTTYSVPTLGDGSVSYYDMPSAHWATPSVSTLASSGIISGYEDGSYRPDNSITRAEFAKLVVSAFSVDATEKNDFSDVNSADWYAPFVAKAAGSGLITGYDGMFNPNGNITRQDAAVILYRMAALAGVNYSGSAIFDDITDISLYAITAVRGLANAGIITGDENYRFNPNNSLSRAEAAKLLCGLINNINSKLNEGGN